MSEDGLHERHVADVFRPGRYLTQSVALQHSHHAFGVFEEDALFSAHVDEKFFIEIQHVLQLLVRCGPWRAGVIELVQRQLMERSLRCAERLCACIVVFIICCVIPVEPTQIGICCMGRVCWTSTEASGNE